MLGVILGTNFDFPLKLGLLLLKCYKLPLSRPPFTIINALLREQKYNNAVSSCSTHARFAQEDEYSEV